MRHILPHSLRASLLAASSVAALVAAVAIASCASKPVIDVNLLDPDGVRAAAAWAELVVYKDDCPPLAVREAGDVSGAERTFTVAADQSFPNVGDLEKSKYGFAVMLKNEHCGIIAAGCTPVDLNHHRHITVMLNETTNAAVAACKAANSEACVLGNCVKGDGDAGSSDATADGDATADAGAECKLQVIAADNLDLPIDVGSAYMGPDVVATPKGFVIVYRAIDAAGTTAKAVRQFVDDTGKKATAQTSDAPGCAGNQAANGLAAAWSAQQSAGFMTIASIPCGSEPAKAYVANFDQDGKSLADVSYPLPGEIAVAPVAGAASSPNSVKYFLASVSGGAPQLYTFTGSVVEPTIETVDNGGGVSTFAQIATATKIVATLADTDSQSGRIAVAVRAPTAATFQDVFLPAAPFAALTAWSNRALAAIPSGNLVSWQVLDATGTAVADGSLTGGPFASLDTTTTGNYALVAGGAAGKIMVFRIDDANGTMQGGSTLQVTLAATLGKATLANFDGSRLSIAAARGRLVIAWINSASPTADDTTPPGGYAVLGCGN